MSERTLRLFIPVGVADAVSTRIEEEEEELLELHQDRILRRKFDEIFQLRMEAKFAKLALQLFCNS